MRKNIVALLVYLLVFAVIFGLSVYDYIHNLSIIEIGMSAKIIDLIIVGLSALSVLRITWHLYTY